ncbi:motility protein A [Acetobacterium sp. KB-1]|uniref:motility protein A n=1 Tax=Acetobacterium sp. KB-1 TaxID=2184575 RepID=UPI000DBEBF38|nr:MotA/TolQ/ExbB proton channel family protein [Acetobacterium sp. KB-1]AWW26422.1 motility protein A [Acetobacterium sp. KB-1]
MEITTIIAYVLVVFTMFFGMTFGASGFNIGALGNFINVQSIFITVGGTFFVLLAAFPIKSFTHIPKHLKMILFKNKQDPAEYVEILTELSKEARRKGLLALEAKAADIQDEFLKESVLRIVDAIEPDKLRSWFDQKLDYISARNDEERKLYDMGAALGPAFGMIGTLIGLINMLKNMSFEGGASTLGSDMSVALITTLYGSILAKTLFMPISNKLEIAQERDLLIKELVIEGVVAIKEGENPKYIQDKLMNFLTEAEIKKANGEEPTKGGKAKGGKAKAKKGKDVES